MTATKIKRFFACRPKLDKAYMTSDATIFIKKKNAEIHAKSLKDNKISPIQRGKKN
jgi:hypothetical protein